MGNKKIEITEQQRLNRQINYYIIRRLWQYKKGCVESENIKDDLYEVLGVARNTYTIFVTGSTYRTPKISKEKSQALLKTGLPFEVFNGDRAIEIHNIGIEEWKKYFENRYAEKKGIIRENMLADMNSKLLKEFSEIKTAYQYDSDLFSLFYFIETGEQFSGDYRKQYIMHCLKSLKDISFNSWDIFTDAELKKYVALLKEQAETVQTIIRYRELSGNIKK